MLSVRVGRVVTDRIAHLNHEAVVRRIDPSSVVRLGVAVFESNERELRGHPLDVGVAPRHLAWNRISRGVDEKVREALAVLLAADACPPDLRKTILERRIPAVLFPVVGPPGPRTLLDVFALQNPSAPVRIL